MVYLLFQIGADRYVLGAARIATVEPLVRLKRIPGAAAGVAGVFDYHGAPVPVVDLSAMALGSRAPESMSTRIIVVHYEGERILGLLAEKVVETAEFAEADFREPGVTGAPYLGPVAVAASGIVQRVELERLLSPEVRDALWRQAKEVLA